VAVFLPCYPPFLETIKAMRRRVVPIPVTPAGDWDRDVPTSARVLLLVNPHNPTGKTFDAEELGWIDCGGVGSERYVRLNFATSRGVLDRIVDAMRDALRP
jgi:bifunctional pyridoxal-dependent enzyme with beta-cystathionase and maltose regulon repressor activities